MRSQHEIESSYKDLCEQIKNEMSDKLHKRKIDINYASSNKRRKIGKPWWDDKLSLLWNKVCRAEKMYLKCLNISQKKAPRISFVKCRKEFSKAVQKSKRLYWFRMQSDLLIDLDKNSCNFWKNIGKIGVGFQKKKKIPMEVLDDTGTVNIDTDFVLKKWKNSFLNLNNASGQDTAIPDITNDTVKHEFIPKFEDEFST